MSTEVAFADASKSQVADVLQERMIEQEYKIWKKNTPYLYVAWHRREMEIRFLVFLI